MVRIPKPQVGPKQKYAFDTVRVAEPLVIRDQTDANAEKIRRAASKYSCRRKELRGRFKVRKVMNGSGLYTVTIYKVKL